MTSKKYELIASDVDGLYRVKALMDFGNVKAGDVGGYVAGEHNLSHGGDCWVSNNARVYGNACVYDDVRVSDNARVFGNAQVFDNAWVSGDARVYGNACVSGNATISNSNDYFIVGPALSSGRYTTVHKTAEGYQINCGCYTTDSIEEFKKRVKGVHSGENLGSYLVIVASLDAWVKSKLKREIENANS
jgi:hypothetical protein